MHETGCDDPQQTEVRSLSEFKEAWNRIKEYVQYVRTTPKSERTELHEDILRSYEQMLIKWAVEKTLPVRALVKISRLIVRILLLFNLL